jgi:uncharacterized protein YcbK (DUF882 family)
VQLVRPALLARLEALRSIRGKPITIVSGYRCPPHNKAIGGASNSQHMYAAAADIPSGLATLEEARRCGFTGVGTKGSWVVHVDVRDGGFTHWVY